MTVTQGDARGTATRGGRRGINIPVLLDGTWSDTNTNTNVGQICGRVPREAAGLVQERCYIEGVGIGPFERIRGGLFGQGLFRGAQTRGAFVPEQQTDFVYSVAGEELGFAGAALIIALFAVLLWRGLRIAAAATGSSRLACMMKTRDGCWPTAT